MTGLTDTKQYVLGRGKVYFSRFEPGTQEPKHWLYMGNTPEFNLTIESEDLAHSNADEGVREEDDSVTLETMRSLSLVTDNVSPENVALAFLGEASLVTQTVVAAADETITDVKLGYSYQLGVTDGNEEGFMGINETGFEVVVGSDTLAAGIDYDMDFDTGLLTLKLTAVDVATGDDIVVTRAVRASTRTRVVTGNTQVEGALRFVAKNAKGPNSVFFMPYVKLSPNGDIALKGDDWQSIPLQGKVLKLEGRDAILRDGYPVYA